MRKRKIFGSFIVTGKIHTKDLKIGKKDIWGHFDVNKTIPINPNVTWEDTIQEGAGTVHVDLKITAKWNKNLSIALTLEAMLFDGSDKEDTTVAYHTVDKDVTILRTVLQLKDKYILDSDTADIELTLSNIQA